MPYRNSVLTQVLRDSLGGNTRTVMVAAVAPEAQHVEESIATCRFAQRVAMISNKCACCSGGRSMAGWLGWTKRLGGWGGGRTAARPKACCVPEQPTTAPAHNRTPSLPTPTAGWR